LFEQPLGVAISLVYLGLKGELSTNAFIAFADDDAAVVADDSGFAVVAAIASNASR